MQENRVQLLGVEAKIRSLYCTRGITPNRVTGTISAALMLRNTGPKTHHSGDDTVSDLTGLGIEPQTYRTDSDVFKHSVFWPAL